MNGSGLRLVFFSLLIGLGIIVASCTSDAGVEIQLRAAESYMELRPDSALHLLEQVSAPDELNNKVRAEYYLLLTQARDKNYMDMSTDSSVVFSVNYFRKKEDKRWLGKALYYYGRVVQAKGEGARAMALFLDACRVLEGTDEDKIIGLAYANIAALNAGQSLYNESVRCCRKAIGYYLRSNNIQNVAFTYQNMGRTFFLMEKMDSARWYAINSLQLLPDNPLRLELGAYKLLGLVYTFQKDYPRAEEMLLKVLDEEPDSCNFYYHNMSLGRLYMLMDQKEKAKGFLSVCLDSPNLFTCSNAYGCLSDLAKKEGDFEEALALKEKEDSIYALAENEKKRGDLVQLQVKYEKEKADKQSLQLKLDKQFLHVAYIVALLLVMGVLYYLYRKYWLAKWQLSRVGRVVEANNKQILHLQNSIKAYQNKKREADSEKQHRITGLYREIEQLKQQNEVQSQRMVKNINITTLIQSLKKGEVVSEKLSAQEWEAIFYLVNSLCSNYLYELNLEKGDIQWTKHNVRLLSLLLLGFSGKELMAIFDYKDLHSVSKAKTRLKSNLGLSKDVSFDDFLQNIRMKK